LALQLSTAAGAAIGFSGGRSRDPASSAPAVIVNTNAPTRIAADIGPAGNRSPNTIIPPAIGTMFDSAPDNGIAIIPRDE